jgi:hypothetical protein
VKIAFNQQKFLVIFITTGIVLEKTGIAWLMWHMQT